MDQAAHSKGETNQAKEIDALNSISEILQTGLNKRTLAVLVDLVESGIDPESLVDGEKLCTRGLFAFQIVFLVISKLHFTFW
jgi:Mitotic-spindle organizing gamma-tubulin ring associated